MSKQPKLELVLESPSGDGSYSGHSDVRFSGVAAQINSCWQGRKSVDSQKWCRQMQSLPRYLPFAVEAGLFELGCLRFSFGISW